jgi:membrane protein implicated in regulation of membrane protease activity
MVFFLVLLGCAAALVVIGAVVDGLLYLLSTGVLLVIAAVLYLLVRSVARSRSRRPAH